jgi:hypothetical protein
VAEGWVGGGGTGGGTGGAAAPGGEINILIEKELIFCTQEILNY